jgi:ATP-binding protein involved in chromosome partitioning
VSDGTPPDAGSRRIRTYAELAGDDRSDLPGQMAQHRARVERRMERVDAVVGVMSGKGGVGKSFVATGLAAALAAEGWRVGFVDADLEAPSAARTLGAEPTGLRATEEGVEPVATPSGVRLVSTALLVEEDAPVRWSGPVEEAHVWRGLQERQVLREFLSDVAWGDLDLLVVDLPPGLGRLEQLLGLVPDLTGLLAVTVPSGVAGSAVERALAVAMDREAPILGVVENMAGYVCPGCGETGGLFEGTAGRDLAERFSLDVLARVPFDPRSAALTDAGELGRLLDATRAVTALRFLSVSIVVPLRGPLVGSPPSIPATMRP